MPEQEKKKRREFTREELLEVLRGVRELSTEELEQVFGGKQLGVSKNGDDREEYTTDAQEIMDDIFGTKMPGR